uniref:Cyclin-dependent kinase-like 2 n=1 Tax=Sander lucioperca TaxID=283035 RepID=A0A8C9ZXI5_SANLU
MLSVLCYKCLSLQCLMERYESLGLVGEGSYGTVLKCRHRDSGRLVAIKKFMDSDDDKTVKKIALREIKLLRQLRHDNLVNLLEVWKRRRRWYLVFEFVERTLLEDLEQNPSGLDLNTSRQYLYQILRAAAFCHQQHIIHRDIKPENILISQGGVVKMCDFGFARTMTSPAEGGVYTDYVATRWYRVLVYVWAVGCLLLEMLTGQPLFPGDSDLDQIYHIVRYFGDLTAHHQELFYRNPVFSGVRLPENSVRVRLEQLLHDVFVIFFYLFVIFFYLFVIFFYLFVFFSNNLSVLPDVFVGFIFNLFVIFFYLFVFFFTFLSFFLPFCLFFYLFTDSATARPISRLKCFQKHVSVNYLRKIRDRILNEAAIMLG